MIIIEGPDGSGKSTLANRLGRLLRLRIFHSGGPITTRAELDEKIEEQFRMKNVIIDRATFMSELIYGRIRASSLYPSCTYEEQARRYISSGWLLIYCRPSAEIIRRNVSTSVSKAHKPNKHLEMVKNNIDRIISDYDVLVSDLQEKGMVILHYVWT